MTSTGTQRTIWAAASESVTERSILERIENPGQFQIELAKYIDLRLPSDDSVVAEIGCESGVTLFLTQKPRTKIFLDYDEVLIGKVRKVADHLRLNYSTCSDDMFNIVSIGESSVDLAFNSGVIEHYLFPERVQALNQIARILKPNGLAIIAYPNHYSLPYRYAYLKKFPQGPTVWPWPEEYKIRDLSAEFREVGIEYEGSVLMDSKSAAGQYSNKYLSRAIRAFSSILPSQRYLKACIGRKL